MASVLLYSGGMDSYCLRHLYNPSVCLHIETGTVDELRERAMIFRELSEKPGSFRLESVSLPMSGYELENKMIPYRNAVFVLLAANYGGIIYLGATLGDTTKDKDYVFKSQMEALLNYFALDQHKMPHNDYPIRLEMPFKNMTKTEILRSYIEAGGSLEELKTYSRSCYRGGDKECGICRSCLRKWAALVNNDVDYRDWFSHDPVREARYEDVEYMRNRGREGADFYNAWKKMGCARPF